MAFTLDKVVPWGRSFEEYVRMFRLTESDLVSGILDVAGGPASFNAAMHARGRRVVSCDPLYQFSAEDISGRIRETRDAVLRATEENRSNFMWTDMQSPSQLGAVRMAAMDQFLEDLPRGLVEDRYRAAQLPTLPFPDNSFDLALCSHFLFTYSDILPLDFHLASGRELCRVAGQARIFPLLPQFGSAHSSLVAPVLARLRSEDYFCEVLRVPYEFQKGGKEMLRVIRPPR